ncbi:glycosyltransferase [Pseudonocardia charpentierae]|uniref:glycosyltransferase n=1 Tax=Pseudonocardia charpentierae TaxID=3075545 RepID=UPI0037C7A450
MAAPGPAGRLPRRRSASGVHRVRQHDPAPRATPRRRRGRCRTGRRARVVQSGWAGLAPAGDDILLVGDLPHDWLFVRTAAVVHHAGAGTTGAGLRAGVPAVPVPVLVDQPFWADRLHRLGVAPRPLPLHELTADTLSDALRSCLDRSTYRDRATELAHRIRAEDGPAVVLSLVARLDGERGRRS